MKPRCIYQRIVASPGGQDIHHRFLLTPDVRYHLEHHSAELLDVIRQPQRHNHLRT